MAAAAAAGGEGEERGGFWAPLPSSHRRLPRVLHPRRPSTTPCRAAPSTARRHHPPRSSPTATQHPPRWRLWGAPDRPNRLQRAARGELVRGGGRGGTARRGRSRRGQRRRAGSSGAGAAAAGAAARSEAVHSGRRGGAARPVRRRPLTERRGDLPGAAGVLRPPPSFLRPPCSRPRTGRQGGGARAAPAEVCAVVERAAVAGLLEIRPRRERARLACSSSGALLGEGAGPSLPIRRSPLAPVASGYLAGRVVAASPRLPPPPPPAPSRHWICDIEGRSFLAPRAVETGSSTASYLLPPAASPPPPAYLQVLVEGPDAVSLAAVVEGHSHTLTDGPILSCAKDHGITASGGHCIAGRMCRNYFFLIIKRRRQVPSQVSYDRARL
ncbi:one cut domain family member 3-like [Panicum virgatum]|uniref:one cut domain family member 3-like n=1 Tax=Panicum virgatum TaxID=38727 RepID=UPI0019D5225F|nr:one cut domain family member 3-like [Panicum virgatum]